MKLDNIRFFDQAEDQQQVTIDLSREGMLEYELDQRHITGVTGKVDPNNEVFNLRFGNRLLRNIKPIHFRGAEILTKT